MLQQSQGALPRPRSSYLTNLVCVCVTFEVVVVEVVVELRHTYQ